jgi:hypothetical protein
MSQVQNPEGLPTSGLQWGVGTVEEAKKPHNPRPHGPHAMTKGKFSSVWTITDAQSLSWTDILVEVKDKHAKGPEKGKKMKQILKNVSGTVKSGEVRPEIPV